MELIPSQTALISHYIVTVVMPSAVEHPNEFNNPWEHRKAIMDCVEQYNTVRPHEALGNLTPCSYFESFFEAA